MVAERGIPDGGKYVGPPSGMPLSATIVFITNALRYTPSVRVVPPAYGAGDDCKRVTRVSQITTETRKRTQDRKARKAASAVHALVLPTWHQE